MFKDDLGSIFESMPSSVDFSIESGENNDVHVEEISATEEPDVKLASEHYVGAADKPAPQRQNPNTIQHLRLRTTNNAFMYFTRKQEDGGVLHTCKLSGPIRYNVLYSDLITLLKVMDKNDNMHLYIESGGGSIRIGTVIMDAIRACRGCVTTISVGCIASMAAGIWSCGHKLVCLPHSDVMYHMSLHGDNGNSNGILKRAATTVFVVNDALVKYFYERGLITEAEKSKMQTSNDAVWIPYMEMNARLKTLNLYTSEVWDG